MSDDNNDVEDFPNRFSTKILSSAAEATVCGQHRREYSDSETESEISPAKPKKMKTRRLQYSSASEDEGNGTRK